MELGTGIFLSTVFVGLIALYGITKDRWNWKKITKYGSISLIIISTLLVFAIYGYDNYKSDSFAQAKFVNPKGLSGITLGQSRSDVIFQLGKPDSVNQNKKDDLTYKNMMVRITDGAVSHIAYWGDRLSEPAVEGFSMYDDLADLKRKFGEPTSSYTNTDETRRIYNFKSKNIGVVMEKGEIIGFWVFDGEKVDGHQFGQ